MGVFNTLKEYKYRILGVAFALLITYGAIAYFSVQAINAQKRLLDGEWQGQLRNDDIINIGFSRSLSWSSLNEGDYQVGDYKLESTNRLWIKATSLDEERLYGTYEFIDKNTLIISFTDLGTIEFKKIDT